MNILHILSQLELTGAESYAIDLGEWQIQQGHHVHVISNTLNIKTKLNFISRKIHTNSSVVRLKNILFLRKFLQENNIQIVHAHSRAAVRVAYWATRGLKVALISTVHGRQHSSFSKKVHDIYGDRVIAVSENTADSLKKDFGMNPRKIKVIGNPLDPQDYPFLETQPATQKIALIGRMTGPKGIIAKNFILKVAAGLLSKYSDLEIHILGGDIEKLGKDFSEEFKNLAARYQNRLKSLGFVDDLHHRLSDYEVIIGAGRVAISSLFRGIPVYALGENSSVGWVTPASFAKAKASNFGDIGSDAVHEEIDYSKILTELDLFLSSPFSPEQRKNRETLKSMALGYFSRARVNTAVLELYKSAYFEKHHPQNIPVLMYHKIPQSNIQSRHRIFVTQENFEKHLEFFKTQGFTTLTFSEIEEFRSLKKDPKNFPSKPLVLTFDDGYIDNLENAAPLLKKYDQKAVIYLLADNNVRYNYWDADSGDARSDIMSPEQKQLLLDSPFEIGSHGLRHEKITEMTNERAWQELTESKKLLEEQFKRPVISYAFTYGLTTPYHAQLAELAGYTFALNTDTGGLSFHENPYSIFRANIFPEDGPRQLKKKTSSWYRKYYYWKRKK